MKPGPPTSTSMSVPVPPGNGVPSTLPMKSMVRNVALRRRPRLLDDHQFALAAGDLVQRAGRSAPRRRLGLQAGQLDGGEIRQRDVGQQLQLDLELQVLGAGSALTSSTLRLGGGAQAAVGQHLLGGLVDALLQHLGRRPRCRSAA